MSQPKSELIEWAMPRWGPYFKFLLEHPEFRRHTPWSDEAIRNDVEEWMEVTALTAPSRVIDLGCGYGLKTIELARKGHSVAGLDSIPGFLKEAEVLAEEEGLPVDWMSGHFPCEVGRDYDLAIAVQCYALWGASPPTAVQAIAGLLTPGGFLVTDGLRPSPSFVEYEAGGWHLRKDGSIVNVSEGRGYSLNTGGKTADIHQARGSREQVKAAMLGAGFQIQATTPWLVGKKVGPANE